MKAVFVDGVGQTKEVDLDRVYQSYRWPIPIDRRKAAIRNLTRRATTDCTFVVADFEWLGRLRDGRLVYTQREAKLSLFRYNMSTTEAECIANKKHSDDIFKTILDDFLLTVGRPIVILNDNVEREKHGLILRRVEGVARPMAKAVWVNQ